MIYVTGDCHGDYRRFNMTCFPEQKEMTKDDYVVICGDFGYWWPTNQREYEMNMLDKRSFTTLFVDGNHEDYDELNKLPVTEWHGGKVHMIRPSVIHLMRGQYFEDIDGTSVFSFGGAASHDIQGGIFHAIDAEGCVRKQRFGAKDIVPDEFSAFKAAQNDNLPYRVEHFSWWKEEEPTEAEAAEGLANLEKHNFEVDFIFSHDGPQSLLSIATMGQIKPDKTRTILQTFYETADYKRWFFGHHHDNVNITPTDILIYEQIIQIH